MRPGTSADHPRRVHEAYEAVRDKWIAERRYLDLVRAITANWTSGNCGAYMAPLTGRLVAEGEVDLHRHLWTRTVKRQATALFHVLASIQDGKPRYLRLLNLDTSGFEETNSADYGNAERAAAFLLQRLTGDIARWRSELRSAGLPTDEPDRVERNLQQLKAPGIRVNRLPAARTPPAARPLPAR